MAPDPFLTKGVHRAEEYRVDPVRCHLRRRDQNKSPMVKVWVREQKLRMMRNLLIDHEKVQIQFAGTPAKAGTAEPSFKIMQELQQGMRGKVGFSHRHGVQKGGLRLHTPGRGFIEGRKTHMVENSGKKPGSRAENPDPVAQVAPQPNQHPMHDEKKWAVEDSNLRPPACKAGALAT